MKKVRIMLTSTVLSLLLLLMLVTTAGAVPAKSGFELQTLKSTVQINKSWTITFSQAVDQTTAQTANIYLTDENNTVVASKLSVSSDELSIAVAPLSNYTANKEYRLYISDKLKAKQSGKFLSKAMVMPFKAVTAAPADYLTSVSANYSNMVSNIKVTATADVYTVKVNGVEMHYEGANSYTLGVKVSKGSTVSITAYDDKDQLLQTKSFKVE